jgi:hypothetical protein
MILFSLVLLQAEASSKPIYFLILFPLLPIPMSSLPADVFRFELWTIPFKPKTRPFLFIRTVNFQHIYIHIRPPLVIIELYFLMGMQSAHRREYEAHGAFTHVVVVSNPFPP